MPFDLNWEKEVYSKKKQINEYPFEWVVASTKNHIKNYKDKKVIEMGSGTGNNIHFFDKLGFKEIVGVEGSKSAVKIANKRFIKRKNVQIILDDFLNSNYPKNYYDLCVDRGSITHNNKKDILKIINNVNYFLKPGGYFFTSLFSIDHYAYSRKKFFFKKEIDSKKGVITSFFSEKEIKKYFKKFKFVSIVCEKKYEIKKKNKKDCWWYLILKK
tara:strand:+ start:153 stop:794 length:642 start_codon:yes stop_codon:yes gene_type:complete